MGHGIAEGVEPTPAELGQTVPTALTGGRMLRVEGVPVAAGDKEIRVTTKFHRNDADLCILEFHCQFPGSDDHTQDWGKAAQAEAELRAILAGHRLLLYGKDETGG